MNREWTAKWIGPESEDQFHPVIFKDFYIDDPIKKATLFIAGFGLFEAYVNGQRVGNEYLTPHHFNLETGIPYYAFDITEMLHCGPESEANSIDVFLGDGWNQELPEGMRFGLRAELEVEVIKRKGAEEIPETFAPEEEFPAELPEGFSADLEEELDELLSDESLLADDNEIYDTEKISLLAMRGEVKTKPANKPHLLDDVEDLDDFLERMIDEEEPAIAKEEAPANPAPAKRRNAQFFTMETTKIEPGKEPVKEEPSAKDADAGEEFDLDIFEFEDWDELNLEEEEPPVIPAAKEVEKTIPVKEEPVIEEPEPLEAVTEEIVEEEPAKVLKGSDLDFEPYGITDAEIEAMFEDIAPFDEEAAPAKPVAEAEPEEVEEPAEAELAEVEEPVEEEQAIEEEPAAEEETIEEELAEDAPVVEDVPVAKEEIEAAPEEALNIEPEAEAEEQIETAEEIPSSEVTDEEAFELDELEGILETELFSDAEIEELLDDSILEDEIEAEAAEEPEVEAVEAEAAEEAEVETEEAGVVEEAETEEPEAEAEEAELAVAGAALAAAVAAEEPETETEETEEPAKAITLIGGLPFVAPEETKAVDEIEAAVDEDVSEAVDGMAKTDEEPLAESGTLVGGLPLAAEEEAGKASDEIVKEWEDAAAADSNPETSLVGGLPFLVKPVAEAAIGAGIADAVDEVSKNEDDNIASDGALVGGLAISEAALSGETDKAEEPETEDNMVTLVGGLPFVVKENAEDEAEPEVEVEAVVDEELSEAVDSIVKTPEPAVATSGALVGGLPIRTEEETETILITTDETWGYYASDIELSDPKEGEIFNRLRWDEEENPEKSVRVLDLEIPMVERENLPVIVKEKLPAESVETLENGDFVLDFGKVFTGFVSFRSNLSRGRKVELTYMKEWKDGSAEATEDRSFVYVSDGVPETVEPHFTLFEGRFVKVRGWEEEPDLSDFTASVLYSDMDRTGYLETSSEVLNRIYTRVLDEQKRVSIRVPEECTERNVYAFAPAASYNMNTKQFLLSYLKELREEKDAGYTSDAAFIIWNLYMMYGDEAILKENYDLMKRWTDAVDSHDGDRGEKHYLYDFDPNYEDLPDIDPKTDPVFLASAYYFETARMISKAAAEIDNEKDAFYYGRLARKIKQAILEEYYTGTGRFALDTQAAYATALRFGLYADKDKTAQAFAARLEKDGYEISLPPVEASYLCRTLAENGMPDLAYDLLLDEKLAEDANVAEFLYTDVVGITPSEPGFSRVRIAPVPDGRLQYCFCTYKTAAGDIISTWNVKENGDLAFHFEIPQGITATIALPYYPVCAAGGNEVTVKGGSYDYTYMPSKKMIPKAAEEVNE